MVSGWEYLDPWVAHAYLDFDFPNDFTRWGRSCKCGACGEPVWGLLFKGSGDGVAGGSGCWILVMIWSVIPLLPECYYTYIFTNYVGAHFYLKYGQDLFKRNIQFSIQFLFKLQFHP